jgi:hypothetical protein
MTAVQQLVIGIFQDRTQAEQAIDELARAGFDQQQIHFAGPGPIISTGGMFDKIKSLFTGQDVSAGWLYDDLARVGLPPEETRYYQSEFEAGRCIVAVQGNVGMQMASLILARHGGYGSNQRFAQSANYSTTAGAQEPAQAPDYDAYGANQHVAPSPDSSQEAGVQEPDREYNANQRVASSPDSSKEARAQEPTNKNVNEEPHESAW